MKRERSLVIATHPDDETLGCGGTLLKHKERGDDVFWLIITSINEKNGFNRDMIDQRKRELDTVAKLYRFNDVISLNFPTMNLDTIPMVSLITAISEVVQRVRPSTVYLPFKEDVHSDHRKVFSAAYSCTKKFRYPSVNRIFMMETISESDFAVPVCSASYLPNYFVNIEDYIEKKIEIMRVYEGELLEHPFPRSEKNIKSLATIRGAQAGCTYAESFMALKIIE